jgi:predicted dehydrogenase
MHVNWLAPVKIRRTLVSGSRRMVVFDDLEASEKIKVYDRGISVDGSPGDVELMRIGYRTGDMWAPQLAIGEALHAVARQFVDLIVAKSPSPSDGLAGLRVVRLLEAATESMANQGRPVSVVGAAAS